jgi:hypothetical protein
MRGVGEIFFENVRLVLLRKRGIIFRIFNWEHKLPRTGSFGHVTHPDMLLLGGARILFDSTRQKNNMFFRHGQKRYRTIFI